MKKLIFIASLIALMISCGNKNQADTSSTTASPTNLGQSLDSITVNVYYFHTNQRCKTCLAIEEVVKTSVENNYAGNDKVKLQIVNVDKDENEALTQKYQMAGSGLVVAKGDNMVELTNEAFATAVNSPEILTNQIIGEINKRLSE